MVDKSIISLRLNNEFYIAEIQTKFANPMLAFLYMPFYLEDKATVEHMVTKGPSSWLATYSHYVWDIKREEFLKARNRQIAETLIRSAITKELSSTERVLYGTPRS
jgi:hypothetical protein